MERHPCSPSRRPWLRWAAAALTLASGAPAALRADDLEQFRVDPLTESWRWQRLEELERLKIAVVRVDPQGHLVVLSDRRSIHRYDGTNLTPFDLPDAIADPHLTALEVTSTGLLVLTSWNSVILWDGQQASTVASVGLGRRAFSTITETADGLLWVGTSQGIVRIDPRDRSASTIPTPQAVLSICEGPDRASLWISLAPGGEVWAAPLEDGRLARRDRWTRRFDPYPQEVLGTNLLRASDGRIWYINDNHTLPGAVFDPATGAWSNVSLAAAGGDDFAFSLLESLDGTIWISSRGALQAWRDGAWRIYRSPQFPVPGARSQLVQDAAGYVFLSEMGGPTLRLDYAQQGGRSYRDLHFQARSQAGDLLFLSARGSVITKDPTGHVLRVDDPSVTGLDTPVVLRVMANGHHFLAGSHQGAAAVAWFDGAAWQSRRFPRFAVSIGHLGVLERRNGVIWFGCAQEGAEFPEYEGGIVRFRPLADGSYEIDHLRPPEVPFRNWSLQQSRDGTIYVAGNGLYRLQASGPELMTLPEMGRNQWIDQVVADGQGNLWMGIWSAGIFRHRGGSWQEETSSQGLNSLLVSHLLAPSDGAPLATTREGLFRFDGDHWAPYLARGAGLHRGSGHLVDGGDGSVWINRTHVGWYYRAQRPETYPEVNLEGFGTTQYVPDRQPPETAWAIPAPDLTRDRTFTLHPTARDAWSATVPEALEYSYRHNAGPWSPFRRLSHILLDDLRGGDHRIEVRARDLAFNIDPTPAVASFTVLLPLWQQAWFLVLVTVVILLFIGLITLFVRQRIRHILELEAVKMRFFTEISHEIKTPLSLILGPLERLQSEVRDSEHQHLLSLIKSNGQRLLHLVNQLLDFRKLQLRQLEYQAEVSDFLPFARSCTAVFSGWAEERQLDLQFESALPQLTFSFDSERFHKIIDNLVNNAVKYTPPGGRIRVRVGTLPARGGQPWAFFEVEDNGPGIPASEHDSVFEPFFRSAQTAAMPEGTGIGLALVKELAEAIGGRIELVCPAHPDDAAHPGCRFHVAFPLIEFTDAPAAAEVPASPRADGDAADGEDAGSERSLVLLIEDSRDLRHFIAGELGRQFRVQTAENAEDGQQLARDLIPDLIISDVVLPGKSGIELGRLLKADPHTSHIPLVLLTALRSDTHKRQGYESGADDYLTKPVSPEILRLKVRNLLETQRRTRDQVRVRFVEDQRVTGLAEAEQEFLDKVDQVIEQNLSEEGFDVVVLAQKLGFSRSAFYRKFNALLNLSPAAYIKTKRLRRAARLLAEGTRTVTEIAFEVGFSDSGYFSRVFKEEYGCSPSEFSRVDRATEKRD